MVFHPSVLHAAGTEDFSPVLHDAGAAGADQRPADSTDLPLACVLPLERVFLSARVPDSDRPFLVIGGGRTVLPGVAVFDDFPAVPAGASDGGGFDRPGAAVSGGDVHGRTREQAGLRADGWVFGRAGNRGVAGLCGAERRRLTADGATAWTVAVVDRVASVGGGGGAEPMAPAPGRCCRRNRRFST